MSVGVSGTEGYAGQAEALAVQWQRVPFEAQHGALAHLLPAAPSRILDVGAGAGRDAAAFAAMGHRVVAVEPVDALRAAGRRLHPSARIEWLDDSLPDLTVVRATKPPFDVVMLTAVWMHLDAAQRRAAMPNVSALVRDGGVVSLSLRHGATPPGRRMFDVCADETIALARAHGLHVVLHMHGASVQPENRRLGVTWTRLAFRRRAAAQALSPEAAGR